MRSVRPVWLRLLLLLVPTCAWSAPDPYPELAGAYLVQHDDRVLWAHGETTPLPPASLTKLMTALIVTESGRLDETVTVAPEAARATGSSMRLAAGDRLAARDLLGAALIASANDACRALAIWHSGTEAAFVDAMNQRAKALALRDTHFRNACGHDAPGHVSSARDLARLAITAMDLAPIAEAVKRIEHVVTTVDHRKRFPLRNRNALIGRYAGAIGVKTGYTQRAGPCVIALAVRGGHRVMLVLLRAKNRWWDAHALLDRAFATGSAAQ